MARRLMTTVHQYYAAHPTCLFTRTQQIQTELPSIVCVRKTSSSSKNLFHGKRLKLLSLGIASGLGVGMLASTVWSARQQTTNAVESIPIDPTNSESGWLPKTEEINAHFQAHVEAGELILLRSTKTPLNRVVYSLSHPQKGAHFEYAMYYEVPTQKLQAVIQFGPQTQGPPGLVHGGATSTMFDTVTGVFLHSGLKKTCVTANLNINFRRPIPLNSAVIAEAWVEKSEGRKHLVRCEFKSTEGQVLIEGTALWISVKTS